MRCGAVRCGAVRCGTVRDFSFTAQCRADFRVAWSHFFPFNRNVSSMRDAYRLPRDAYRLPLFTYCNFHKPGVYRSGRACVTCGTCFVATHLELVAVTVLMWLWWSCWCVLSIRRDFVLFCFVFVFPVNGNRLLQVKGTLASSTTLPQLSHAVRCDAGFCF